MAKRSNSFDESDSKTPAMLGLIVPVKSTGSFEATKVSGGGKGSYENTSRVSYGDKQSGCYGRETTKEKASAGDFYWKNGTTGTRTAYTQSSTVRVGDKSGYTEVHLEKTVRDVTYNRSGCSNKNYITSGNEGGGSYGGHGNDSDDGGSYGGHGNDSDDGGPYGGHGYDSDDGGYGYNSDHGGSYGGYGYDSD